MSGGGRKWKTHGEGKKLGDIECKSTEDKTDGHSSGQDCVHIFKYQVETYNTASLQQYVRTRRAGWIN